LPLAERRRERDRLIVNIAAWLQSALRIGPRRAAALIEAAGARLEAGHQHISGPRFAELDAATLAELARRIRDGLDVAPARADGSRGPKFATLLDILGYRKSCGDRS